MSNRNPDVDEWFASYENPQKDLVQAVRNGLLAGKGDTSRVARFESIEDLEAKKPPSTH